MNKPFKRRKSRLRYREEIAYDLETTAIAAGTPSPRYLSLYDGETAHGYVCQSMPELGALVVRTMLTDDTVGKRYIAFNGNRFDAYLVVLSLLTEPQYRAEPWLARSDAFRGMMVVDIENEKRRWFFSDTIAMFGFQGGLDDFLKVFAPDYHKQHIDVLNFDAHNPKHVEYAINDAVALWHASRNAGQTMKEATGIPPQNTIGKAAIKLFEANIPDGTLIWRVPESALLPLKQTKRGGYVHCAGRYRGPVWKYDLNQAYPSAMRNDLPAGRCTRTKGWIPDVLGIYRATVSRVDKTNIPFYMKDDVTNKMIYTYGQEVTGWLCSPEIIFLQQTGWDVMIYEGWYWADTFNMSPLVDHLEEARLTCEGGPKGPRGYMYKMMGNNAYGKTLELASGVRVVVAAECPRGYHPLYEEDEAFNGLWFRMEDVSDVTYRRAQIGTFITAYVRLTIMRTALLAPEAFRYADTDCVVFDRDMSDQIWIDPGKYGAFKQEEAGEVFVFINKKVYCSEAWYTDDDGKKRPCTAHAKGLRVKDLTIDDFERWYAGDLPVQTQTQRQSIIKVLSGAGMFNDHARTGSFVLPMAAD